MNNITKKPTWGDNVVNGLLRTGGVVGLGLQKAAESDAAQTFKAGVGGLYSDAKKQVRDQLSTSPDGRKWVERTGRASHELGELGSQLGQFAIDASPHAGRAILAIVKFGFDAVQVALDHGSNAAKHIVGKPVP